MPKTNLDQAFEALREQWSPQVVADVNDCQVKIARIEGDFHWHAHADEDELFLVLDGQLTICLRDRDVDLGPGELFVVPRGTEHKPVTRGGEVRILLIEPRSTVREGNG